MEDSVMADQYNILEDAVSDMFARAVWSHKIQEKQADIYQKQFSAFFYLCGFKAIFGIRKLYLKIRELH